jgi:hypothetical protein
MRNTTTLTKQIYTVEAPPKSDAPAIFVLLIAVLVVGYMLPSFVALCRAHRSAGGIIVLNVLLGWTFVFWVISLAWSASNARR